MKDGSIVPQTTPDGIVETALAALKSVAADPKAPPAARVQAAAGLLNYAVKTNAPGAPMGAPGAAVSDLSLDQIDAELAALAAPGDPSAIHP